MASNTEHYILPPPRFDEPPSVAIVIAPYYKDIGDWLLEGARTALEAAGAKVEVIEVPGALEIPSAIRQAHRSGDFDAYVALGCVIRGATTHYDIVAGESSRALTDLGLVGLAIGNGILTVENWEQAEERANPAKMNKGGGAAEAALHVLKLAQRFSDNVKGVGFHTRLGGDS
ncbi:MAG: 6,7-dimethyl-8-ribityllumazine synthase [Pseudomonadota bacterium]